MIRSCVFGLGNCAYEPLIWWRMTPSFDDRDLVDSLCVEGIEIGLIGFEVMVGV